MVDCVHCHRDSIVPPACLPCPAEPGQDSRMAEHGYGGGGRLEGDVRSSATAAAATAAADYRELPARAGPTENTPILNNPPSPVRAWGTPDEHEFVRRRCRLRGRVLSWAHHSTPPASPPTPVPALPPLPPPRGHTRTSLDALPVALMLSCIPGRHTFFFSLFSRVSPVELTARGQFRWVRWASVCIDSDEGEASPPLTASRLELQGFGADNAYNPNYHESPQKSKKFYTVVSVAIFWKRRDGVPFSSFFFLSRGCGQLPRSADAGRVSVVHGGQYLMLD
jgi:hypothetical protein